jgi:hypothetical protein
VTPRIPNSDSPRHWHLTRDIKPRGECPACDLSWKVMDDFEKNAQQNARDSSNGG